MLGTGLQVKKHQAPGGGAAGVMCCTWAGVQAITGENMQQVGVPVPGIQ